MDVDSVMQKLLQHTRFRPFRKWLNCFNMSPTTGVKSQPPCHLLEPWEQSTAQRTLPGSHHLSGNYKQAKQSSFNNGVQCPRALQLRGLQLWGLRVRLINLGFETVGFITLSFLRLRLLAVSLVNQKFMTLNTQVRGLILWALRASGLVSKSWYSI